MGYQRLGLAALLVSAFRSAVPNTEQEARDEAQETQLAELRQQFQAQVDSSRTAFDQLIERVGGIEARDGDQQGVIDGVVAELQEMADAFTGPAGDPDDNGLAGEVTPEPTATPSDTVDAVVTDAIDAGIEVPDPVVLPEGGQGGGDQGTGGADGDLSGGTGEDGTQGEDDQVGSAGTGTDAAAAAGALGGDQSGGQGQGGTEFQRDE